MDITTMTYDGSLKAEEEQMFRGAFLKEMGNTASALLHNHVDGGLRYGYPLVQYKVIGGRPVIVGIGEGCSALNDVPRVCTLMIGRQPRAFRLKDIHIEPYEPAVDDAPKMYALTRYIPLNTDNMERFERMAALTDRVCFLESLINANILAFFKGVGYHCEEDIQTAITNVDKKYFVYYKGIKFLAFDLHLITNALLPDHIGLGKSSSVGFGTIARKPIPEKWLEGLASRS